MDIETARANVDDMTKSLLPISREICDKYSKSIDSIIKYISSAKYLTNEEIRDKMLALSVESYMFGMSKDESVLKQECSTALLKESMAQSYNSTDGTQAVRTNQSIIDTADKQVVNILYSSVSNFMKTKLDEAHRVINTLNSILISRNAEAKMSINKPDEDVAPTRQRLYEDVGDRILF